MNYHLAAIPAEFPAPTSSTEFDPEQMTAMFDEGVRLVLPGTAWRSHPPGVEPGESVQERTGTCLTRVPRPRGADCAAKRLLGGVPQSQQGIPSGYPTVLDR